MDMTTGSAVARALDMIDTIATLSDGLAQRNAAQTKFYIASLHDVGLLSREQFESLNKQADNALHDWEVHHAMLDGGID